MSELFFSGRIVDVIIGLILLQGLLGQVLVPRIIRLSTRDYFFTVLPGIMLLLSLRAALVQAQWLWISACLLGGLLTHWLDLWHRNHARQEFRE